MSDLRLLKSTLKDIGLSPNDEINYLDALVAIHDYKLLEDELSGKSIEVDEYVPLTATVVLGKLNRLETDERNLVSFCKRHIDKRSTDKEIRNELVELYLKDELAANVNSSVSRFDFILELLFNLSEMNPQDAVCPEPVDTAESSSEAEEEYLDLDTIARTYLEY